MKRASKPHNDAESRPRAVGRSRWLGTWYPIVFPNHGMWREQTIRARPQWVKPQRAAKASTDALALGFAGETAQKRKFWRRFAGFSPMEKHSALHAMLPFGRRDGPANTAKSLAKSEAKDDSTAVDIYIDHVLDRPTDADACRTALRVALKLHRLDPQAALRLCDGLQSHSAYASAWADAKRQCSMKNARCLPPPHAARDADLLSRLPGPPHVKARLPHGWRQIDTINGGVQISSLALAALHTVLAVEDLFAATPLATQLPHGVGLLTREERLVVFSYEKLVFKVYNPRSQIAQEHDPWGLRSQPGHQYAQTRFDRTKKAAEICESEGLSDLVVPSAALIETVYGRQARAIVEERLQFASADEAQEKLYADLDLPVVLQLARFIFLTGSCDAEWRNFPVLPVGNKKGCVAIVDAESVGNGNLGILGSLWNTLEYSHRRGIIAMLSHEKIMWEVVKSVSAWNNEASGWGHVADVDECIAYRKNEMARNAVLDAYLQGFDGHLDQPVRSVPVNGFAESMHAVVRSINAALRSNESIEGRRRRQVVLDCDDVYARRCLGALKKAGAIFDFGWVCQGRIGWHVWA